LWVYCRLIYKENSGQKILSNRTNLVSVAFRKLKISLLFFVIFSHQNSPVERALLTLISWNLVELCLIILVRKNRVQKVDGVNNKGIVLLAVLLFLAEIVVGQES